MTAVDREVARQTALTQAAALLARTGARRGLNTALLFEGWLDFVNAGLDGLTLLAGRHLDRESASVNEAELADFLRSAAIPLPESLRGEKGVQGGLVQATLALSRASRFGYYDLLGSVYQTLGQTNHRLGQYFTPWPVARLMAQMQGGEADLIKRLGDAAEKACAADPAVQTLFNQVGGNLLLGGDRNLGSLNRQFITEVLPALIPYYEPLKVIDPAVGSGVLLLAHAAGMPRWAVVYGLVQYHGVDLDPLCVKLARLNLRLYGLNGAYFQTSVQSSGFKVMDHNAER